jgi:hypothetical protein
VDPVPPCGEQEKPARCKQTPHRKEIPKLYMSAHQKPAFLIDPAGIELPHGFPVAVPELSLGRWIMCSSVSASSRIDETTRRHFTPRSGLSVGLSVCAVSRLVTDTNDAA